MKLSLQPRAEVSIFIHNFVSARADEDLLCKNISYTIILKNYLVAA